MAKSEWSRKFDERQARQSRTEARTRERKAQAEAEREALVEKYSLQFRQMREFLAEVGEILEQGTMWTVETIHEGVREGRWPTGRYRLVNQAETISLERIDILWLSATERLRFEGEYPSTFWPEERRFDTYSPPDGPSGPRGTVTTTRGIEHVAGHIRRRALPQYRARMAWIEEWIRDRAIWWTGIDAMAGKLHRAAEGFPELELLSTQKAAHGIRAEIDEAILVVHVGEPARMRIELNNATPALALTIVDAIKAYARLNGLLVCAACGHPQHRPVECPMSDGGEQMCMCEDGVPEFDLIEGGGR